MDNKVRRSSSGQFSALNRRMSGDCGNAGPGQSVDRYRYGMTTVEPLTIE